MKLLICPQNSTSPFWPLSIAFRRPLRGHTNLHIDAIQQATLYAAEDPMKIYVRGHWVGVSP